MEFKEYECQKCKNQFVDDEMKEAEGSTDIDCPICGSKDVAICGSVGMLDYFRRIMGSGYG